MARDNQLKTDEPVQFQPTEGKRPDFVRLYKESFDEIYAFIARRVQTRDETEDLTAEVFHQALRSLDGFRWQGTPLIGWIYGIARNVLAAHWRRLGRASAAALPEDPGTETDGEVERRMLLTELVRSLTHDQRTVIERRFIDQMPIRQIAQELGRSEGAIKQLQLRALENLRKRLGDSK